MICYETEDNLIVFVGSKVGSVSEVCEPNSGWWVIGTPNFIPFSAFIGFRPRLLISRFAFVKISASSVGMLDWASGRIAGRRVVNVKPWKGATCIMTSF